jgi:IS30 family transposase
MDHLNDTTEHVKNKHLTYDDRMVIQLRLQDGWSPYRIAKYALHCAANTVRNEIRRGTVWLYHGKVARYKAKAGAIGYSAHRANSRRQYQSLEKARFLRYVIQRFQEDGWSPDACVGRALQSGLFSREEVVCTKTLYNYVDLGLIPIKNIDLPEKLRRKPTKHHDREHKKELGRSIEERPSSIENREEFGHWEADLVIGSKSGDDMVLLTLLERKSRNFLMLRVANKTSAAVMLAFEQIRSCYGTAFSQAFKTITTDNGSEFSQLSELESAATTLVFYAHPFSSWEKGSVERHNGLIRRFIPKGKRIDSFSADQIAEVEMWSNQLPRKLLGYRTPEEVFEAEMDLLYAA